MTISPYLLVFWIDEGRFSVVNRTTLTVDREKTLQDDELVGITTRIFWGKKDYGAEIKECGEKRKLNISVKKLNKPTQGNSAVKTNLFIDFDQVLLNSPTSVSQRNNEIQEQTEMQEIEEEVDIHEQEEDKLQQNDEQDELSDVDWKKRYDKLRKKYAKCKDHCKELEVIITSLQSRENDLDEKIRIGHGVYLKNIILEKIQAVSDTPEKLARNLFQALFVDEELLGKSLCGGTCATPVPTIDKAKRDAIIGFVLKKYTGHRITKKGKGHGSQTNSILNSVKKSLSERIRYVNKRVRNAGSEH